MDIPQEPGRLTIGGNLIEFWAGGTTRTTFPDGRTLTGHPDGSKAQYETAYSLGYGRDLPSMVREHEILHTLLAVHLGLPACSVLEAAASGEPLDTDEARQIEALVLDVQATLNGRRIPSLDASGWDFLAEAGKLLRPKGD